MARITVEDCLDKVKSRYELIVLAAKRARQLAVGGRRPTLEWEDDKPTVMALREIEAGTVSTENINELKVDIADLEQEFSDELSAEDLPKF
tara:strand:+ start:21242 stop:21514 length:273 start_codon:yes stop_codon:yes gene_type:complete